jgi:hypothetical protein
MNAYAMKLIMAVGSNLMNENVSGISISNKANRKAAAADAISATMTEAGYKAHSTNRGDVDVGVIATYRRRQKLSRAAISVNRECGTEAAIGGGFGELLGVINNNKM